MRLLIPDRPQFQAPPHVTRCAHSTMVSRRHDVTSKWFVNGMRGELLPQLLTVVVPVGIRTTTWTWPSSAEVVATGRLVGAMPLI